MREVTTSFFSETESAAVQKWHSSQGGHCRMGPAPHALRGLNEYVELCLAAGCTPTQILARVAKEVKRQGEKGNTGGYFNPEEFVEEYGDVRICLEIMRMYGGIDERAVTVATLMRLSGRQFKADENGVLWRPGREMPI